MATVDRILTEYGIIDNYSARASAISASTEKLGSVVNKVKGYFVAAGVAIGIAGASVAGFAVKSAVELDTAERRLQAFAGSAEEAARQMEFIKRLAAPSIFETKDLAKAGTLLAAYGLNIEKVLPLANSLATAMGDGGESVSEIARVFGRLKAGDFGEAFERLRDFGISFDDLKSKGLAFSKSNQFLGNSFQALNAVSQIVEQRFGKISALMESSPAAKLASGMDAIRNMAAKAGDVILTAVTPALEKVTKFITFLGETGKMKSFIDGWVVAGKTIASFLGGEEGLMRMGVTLFTFFQELPYIVSGMATRIIAFVKDLSGVVTTILNIPAKLWNGILSGLEAGINAIRGVIEGAADIIGKVFGMEKERSIPKADFGGMKIPEYKNIGDAIGSGIIDVLGFGNSRENIIQNANDIMKGFGAFQPNGGGGAASSPAGMGFTANDSALQNPLGEIARNTRSTAENTQKAIDFKRYALGGGDLGALGVSPIEMGQGRGGGGANINVTAGRDALAQAMKGFAETVIQDLKRQGLLK